MTIKERIKSILPESDNKRLFAVSAFTAVIGGILVAIGVYVQSIYGLALFYIVPFFMGVCAPVLYGLKNGITLGRASRVMLLSISMLWFALLFFAVEGLICLTMAVPLVAVCGWLGSLLGYYIIKKDSKNPHTVLLIVLGCFPVVGFVEKDHRPELTSVVTSIEIDADAEVIWKNVVEFPPLDAPSEWLFNAGIAYPTDARIDGAGVGAVRHCNFTTGSFVEPITTWDEPRLLAFDVAEQPAPMKELSFWDIDAPHLHDYFVSKKGQFKLIPLPNGHILLEGTTWYYHNIRPEFYWQWWSDYIVHKIHRRVLEHIKRNAERAC